MVVVIAILVATSLLVAILSPFWLCEEGVLLPATIADNPDALEHQRQKILEEYCRDEEALQQGTITSREWRTRRAYLINRYVDLSRRRDFLARLVLIAFCFGGLGTKRSWLHAGEGEASHTVARTPRHIVILTADLDHIWGTYFFAINNTLSIPQRFRTPVMVPREAIDFRAQDGFTNEEVQIEGEGKIFLEKEFPPGISLLSLSFQSKVAPFSDDVLTFIPPVHLEEFTLAVGANSDLELISPQFTRDLPPMLSAATYRGIMRGGIATGESCRLVIHGIPKARYYSWVIASVFGVLLVTGAGALVVRNRPTREKREV